MKIKLSKLAGLLQGFNLVNNLSGFKFAYGIAKNRKIVEEELKILSEVITPSKEFTEYDKQRVELCKKYATKDAKGKPVIVNGAFSGLKQNSKFDKEIEELRTKFKVALDKRRKEEEDYNKMLEDEIDVNFHMIEAKSIPDNITVGQMQSIMPVVKDK